MITSITSTLIREGCSITSITSYIFGSNGSITSSLLQIVLHYYTITSITSSSLLHKHFHYFPLVGKVMGSNGSITSYYVPPQLGDVNLSGPGRGWAGPGWCVVATAGQAPGLGGAILRCRAAPGRPGN